MDFNTYLNKYLNHYPYRYAYVYALIDWYRDTYGDKPRYNTHNTGNTNGYVANLDPDTNQIIITHPNQDTPTD